ncbi:hypothetical protein NC651_033224 [Populus alba x Populus x berolinensis]|nr:hypothetical protein NC651_033224 [Populus alba x Populus x berolinensis]
MQEKWPRELPIYCVIQRSVIPYSSKKGAKGTS